MLQSNDAFDAADAGTLPQAIALLTDATRADPKSAIGWGSLALAYAVRKRASPLADRPGFHSRARSAALKALKLDPDEPRALAALRLIDPLYGNWLKAERADRAALKQQPTFPILLFVLSKLLGSVGRWNEAAGLSKKLDRGKFLIPGADRQVVLNLWSAGELQEADDALDIAVQHWPLNPQIWRTRLGYLMYSGRPNEALALLRNESEQPPGIAGGAVAAISATAQALGERVGAAAALATNLKHLKSDPTAAFETIHACASLGDANTAFAILEGYFFGRGKWASVAPAGGDEDRVTDLLFQPPMRRLWPDPRFNQLVERIGLGRYWRDTHTVPDFRHSA